MCICTDLVLLLVTGYTLWQSCTRFLHACSALCKCADWLCRTCTPHHTIAGRSSVSLTESPFAFPSATATTAVAALPSPATCQDGPGRSIPCTCASTAAHIIAHCALCTACAPLHYGDHTVDI
jgi:hypothetical protein